MSSASPMPRSVDESKRRMKAVMSSVRLDLMSAWKKDAIDLAMAARAPWKLSRERIWAKASERESDEELLDICVLIEA